MSEPTFEPSSLQKRRGLNPINPLYEGMRGFSLTLGDGHRMDLLVTRALTPHEFGKLRDMVELMRDAMVAEAETPHA